jgi:predicted DNA-binding protein with PD1-like motif
MQYRKQDAQVLIRIDRDEDILQTILAICAKEDISGAVFTGIGACGRAVLSTYLPEENSFLDREVEGMLDLISLNGNISMEHRVRREHTHAVISCRMDGENKVLAGHLTCAVVRYTAEILMTVTSPIHRKYDSVTGITVLDL